MTIGTSVQSTINVTINKLGSSATITPRSPTVSDGQFGGYTGNTEGRGTPVVTLAVPIQTLGTIAPKTFGNLRQGEVDIAFKGTETIDENSIITWLGKEYEIRKGGVESVILLDVTVAIFVRGVKLGS